MGSLKVHVHQTLRLCILLMVSSVNMVPTDSYYTTTETPTSQHLQKQSVLNDTDTSTNGSDYIHQGNHTDIIPEDMFIIPEECRNYTSTGSHCGYCYDRYFLWSPTKAGDKSYQPCPTSDSEHVPELKGYASRLCNENGTWEVKADFSECIDELLEFEEKKERELQVFKTSTFIYLGGFILSNIAMIIAVIIFGRYKHLRCLRNLIHSQLFIGITIKNFLWMGIMIGTLNHSLFEKALDCKIIFTLYRFFQLSQFSWMFIEGLYLFIVVVSASLTDLLHFRHCMLIGWGIPFVITVTCALVNFFKSDDICWQSGQLHTPANSIETVSISLLLLINAGFMAGVIYTLVRKLRNSLNQSKQYSKAVKATIVLVPLLGGTYLMVYFSYSYEAYAVWVYVNSVIQSTLGFIVALVYCFLNEEVRSSLAKSYRHWKDEQTLPSSDWWSRRRRSSYVIKRDETETDTTTCQYSSRRNSRRVSEDTLSSSRRGSHIPDTILPTDFNSNKVRKTSPLAFRPPLVEKDAPKAQTSLLVTNQNVDSIKSTVTRLNNQLNQLEVPTSAVMV